VQTTPAMRYHGAMALSRARNQPDDPPAARRGD